MAATLLPALGSVSLTVANFLIPISIIVFGIGFFPYKPFLPGLAEYGYSELGQPPSAHFDRLVFMVVDALRSDFVYSNESGFEFTQSLIRDGAAMPFTANARSPTVTMPRLKAITTGSIPSFVDLILNFDEADTSSTLAAQDTWLAQIKATDQGKLLMFGDDTWLKLFPETFDREDGTTSFFVSDFTEVDTNVTRNIAGELGHTDWSLMILHYLGLDHIGHKSGPRSSNMIPKQQEMDGIVRRIFEAMESREHLKSTLFVLCGDHGMNDAGNHGASSPGETSPALVFMSPKLRSISPKYHAPSSPKDEFDYYSAVEQSDITPTLAALLGFPISKNNLGAFIPEFLPFWPSSSDKIQILLRNGHQILDIVTAVFGPELFELGGNSDPCRLESTDVNQLACDWRKLNSRAAELRDTAELDPEWVSDMSRWLRTAQDLMSSMASNYDMPKLLAGLALAVVAVFSSFVSLHSTKSGRGGTSLALPIIAVSYGLMMFASSYVEEEHHFWYWVSTLWVAWLGVRAIQRTRKWNTFFRHALVLGMIRLIRSWNQTGQKFAGTPDTVKLFISPHPQLLWALIAFTYALPSLQMIPNFRDIPSLAVTSVLSILVSSAVTFKLAFTAEDSPELVAGPAKRLNDVLHGQSLVSRARVVFAMLGAATVLAIFQTRKGGQKAVASVNILHHLYSILAMTQSRATNIPLFLLSTITFHSLDPNQLSVADITTTSVLFQYASFFAFGGSNAISSVDLSNAYNGIGGFNVVAVGVLTFISNWAGPVYWVSACNLWLLQKHGQGHREVLRRHMIRMTCFMTISMASVIVACTVLRAHLFIWTVFSPKYLYSMAWSLAQHLVINMGLGSLLFALGTR